jgi:hypothetical protein
MIAAAEHRLTGEAERGMEDVACAAGRLIVVCCLCAGVSLAHAQVYKCHDAAGRTVYADAPCAAGGKSLKLPGEATELRTDRTVCAQLQDERQRLAADAERDAKRGRKESAASAKRRQQLTTQYERRCIGISRSAGG